MRTLVLLLALFSHVFVNAADAEFPKEEDAKAALAKEFSREEISKRLKNLEIELKEVFARLKLNPEITIDNESLTARLKTMKFYIHAEDKELNYLPAHQVEGPQRGGLLFEFSIAKGAPFIEKAPFPMKWYDHYWFRYSNIQHIRNGFYLGFSLKYGANIDSKITEEVKP